MTKSYAEHIKAISAQIRTSLRGKGFRKRGNRFNRRLENGLIHEISVFAVGSYSIDHSKGYLHVGCYIPEVELYNQNADSPVWVTGSLCTLRGMFPNMQSDGRHYFDIEEQSHDVTATDTLTHRALSALHKLETYNDIFDYDQASGSMYFSPPRGIALACIHLARKQPSEAEKLLNEHLDGVEPHLAAHKVHVRAWASRFGLAAG